MSARVSSGTNSTVLTTVKFTAVAQIIYVFTRTAWKAVPTLTQGDRFSMIDAGIAVAGVGLFLFYHYAFGFGSPQRERQWAIQVYSVGSMVLLAECVLTFWGYHVLRGPLSRHAAVAQAYPAIPKAATAALCRMSTHAPSAAALEAALGVFEKLIDVAGIIACGVGVYQTKEYVMENRQRRREAQDKGALGKAE